jgi:signal transduction histidine kinase/CheY-like chemotaxis protein
LKALGLRTVRGRLWAALALLSVAVLSASAVTWLALQRVDARLQDLHQETLSQVAQALDLSKRSSDLATSAPYLLNQRSNFLIEQEGGKLIKVLDRVRTDWPEARFGNVSAGDPVVSPIIDDMSAGVKDLVAASSQLELIQAQIRNQTAKLGTLRTKATTATTSKRTDDQSRLIWWSLQSMNADALNAAYAGNLIGVGEEQRHYLRQKQTLDVTIMTVEQTAFLVDLEAIVWRVNGVFELRRRELSANLSAQNALFRIRHDANLINELASDYANQAEVFLANERMASSSTIRVTRISVAVISAISLMLALTAAIYVSRYVTFNISRVSAAMVRLANGDRASALPRKLGGEDEIGDLFRSFRSFRANALRLDRSNRQLDQRNALFEKVFTNISDGIAMTDPSGRLTAFNPAFSKILGWPAQSPQVGMWVEWLLDSRFGQSAMNSDLKIDHRGVCDLLSEDGQILEIRASKLPDDGRVWLIGDVTEQRRISDRLQQIDRIETLGRMAGDTAHDFANILSTIRTHAHLLECQKGDETNDSLQAIGNAVDFGSSLTDRLLAFARKQSLVPELVELNALVEGMADLVEISFKPGVKLEVFLATSPLNVLVDPGQLESALFNLLLNANNAINAKGTIKVSLNRRNATHAYILVEDDGHGMSGDVLARAIEPFYTTRSDAGGTGLGLSIVYGFIRQTGGDITIESVPCCGTKIELSLPVAIEISSGPKFKLTKSALLVEDDKKTCDHATVLLQQLGYEVASFATGEEALKATQLRSFDLVLSDFELGGDLNGSEVLRRLAQSTPMTESIMMSGKSAAKTTARDGVNFIEKPLTLQKLASALGVVMPSAPTYRGLQS